MKLKKISLIISLATIMAVPSISNADPLVDTATVNFIGTFQGSTCNISLNQSTSSSGTIDVYLGGYTTDAITADAQSTSGIPFSLNFANCGDLHNAIVEFTGTQTKATLFDVSGTNKDKVGVGVNLTSAEGNYIASGYKTNISLSNGSGSADFYARYVKIGNEKLAAGEANSVATMSVSYQ